MVAGMYRMCEVNIKYGNVINSHVKLTSPNDLVCEFTVLIRMVFLPKICGSHTKSREIQHLYLIYIRAWYTEHVPPAVVPADSIPTETQDTLCTKYSCAFHAKIVH